MRKIFICSSILFFTLPISLFAQGLKWTGDEDSDFFNEKNWVYVHSNEIPLEGVIDPGKEINLELFVSGDTLDAGNAGSGDTLKMGSGTLRIKNAVLDIDQVGIAFCGSEARLVLDSGMAATAFIKSGSVLLNDESVLRLKSAGPLQDGAVVDLKCAGSWIYFMHVNPGETLDACLPQIRSKGGTAVFPDNIRVEQYYQNGTVLRIEDAAYKPLTLFEEENFEGSYAAIPVKTIINPANFPSQFNKRTSSFILKRGYMATIAENEDGTGLSKVYIASESDLQVDALPPALNDNVSFIRVLPWSWTTKRGTGGDIAGLNAGWYYNWGNKAESEPGREFVPMAWGKGSADSDADIAIYINKERSNTVLSFNESDNCNDQSGQYGSLCVPDTAVKYHKNLMKTGMRIGSPACREGEEVKWLAQFMEIAEKEKVRVDFICMHWYDWGANPKATPDADPQNVFNRFKKRIENAYAAYGLPIWITEFNANPNRNTWVHEEFLKLALPYLESAPFVERYAYFQPVSRVADYFEENGEMTNIGKIYSGFVSGSAVAVETLENANNLDGLVLVPLSTNPFFPGEKLNIYPNPASGSIFVTGPSRSFDYLVRDILGNVLMKGQTDSLIDVKSLKAGLYLLNIDGSCHFKFLVQR